MSEERPAKKLGSKALGLAATFYTQAAAAGSKFDGFVEGLKAGLDIEGDYNLNFATGMMEPVEQKPPQEKKEA